MCLSSRVWAGGENKLPETHFLINIHRLRCVPLFSFFFSNHAAVMVEYFVQVYM
jgi:hypothetical protein